MTLDDFPHIRYFDPNGTPDGLCGKLAFQIQKDLDEAHAIDPSFPGESTFKRPILIIVDRSIDMMAPFLHEFTYQAMIKDLIQGHWHFSEAVDHITNSFKKFISENKAAAQAVGAENGMQGVDSLKMMKETLSSLPEFQTMKNKFNVHISICQDCKNLFEKRKLDIVAAVQQDLSTGETVDGKTPKNAMLDLIPVLDNKTVSSYDKLRSLIIYIIAFDGIQDMERKRLLETAKVSNDDSKAITNLAMFNVQLSAGQPKAKYQKNFERYTYWGSHKVERKKRRKNGDTTYDLSRYVPLVKRIVEDQMANNLPKELFPWVKEPTPEELGIAVSSIPKMFRFTTNGLVAPDPNHPYSLRTTRTSWVGARAPKAKGKPTGNEKEEADFRRNGSRIYLFSIGGMTYSEIRAAYELSRDEQREVFFGSTFIYSPNQMVDILKLIHNGEEAQKDLAPLFGIQMAAENVAVVDEKKDKEKKGLFGKKK